MNPNIQQSIDNEENGIEEQQQDIDYDAIYGGIDLDVSNFQPSEEIKKDYKKIFGDVVKQSVKETLIGLGGAYGDLAELAGARKNREVLNEKDLNALHKINNQKSSITDLEELSEDTIVPREFSLPSSEDLRNVNNAIGGPGEPETTPGKFAARTGKLYGAGLAAGQVNPVPALVAGTAGQSIEELGGGPLLQAGAEIASLIASKGKSGKGLVSSEKKEIQDKINDLRKLGYAEEDITLAINSANKGGRKAQIASKSERSKQAFEDFTERSDDVISNILQDRIPGIEKGIKNVHELASDAYGQVAKNAENIIIKNAEPFKKSVQDVMSELKKTLGNNKDANGFMKRLSEAVKDAEKNKSAESFMNFYKELNSMGSWMGRSQKDRLITKVKNGIKDTFKAEGKEGAELANQFEKANEGIRRAYLAQDVNDLIQKVTTQKGIDYKKLNKIFDKPDNVKLLQDVLGETQAKNLKLISNTAKEISDFDKAWKSVNHLAVGTPLDIARGGLGLYYIYQGDWAGLATVLATKAGTAGVRKLAEKSLTDPRFQNLLIRGLHAIKTSSPQSLKSANEDIKKYVDEEGIDLKLD